jgi:hypothetical protein
VAHGSGLSLKDWMSPKGISKWIEALSITDAPVRRAGVKTALEFFDKRMLGLLPTMAWNFMASMDLSRAVSSVLLMPKERVIAFRTKTECEFKLFYTRPGATMYKSGINAHERIAVHYEVSAMTPALVSYTTGAIDVWTIPGPDQFRSLAIRANSTGVMTDGGGIQRIIPNAARTLELLRVGT